MKNRLEEFLVYCKLRISVGYFFDLHQIKLKFKVNLLSNHSLSQPIVFDLYHLII